MFLSFSFLIIAVNLEVMMKRSFHYLHLKNPLLVCILALSFRLFIDHHAPFGVA
jgi:hypothetical protein